MKSAIKPIPIHWKLLEKKEDGEAYKHSIGLIVIWSISKELDGKEWLHVSVSRKSRIPEYKDIMMVKRDFIGDDKKAIMVFPKISEHVNLHPFCLHLFCCIEADVLPDFSQGGISI